MKEFIVTGGKGFIGGHLVQRLLDEGHFVKVIDDERIGKYTISHPNVLYIHEDVANYKAVERDKKATAIFHLANSPRVRRALDYPVDTMRNNIDSTLSIVQLAKDIDCPLYFSTSSSTKYSEAHKNPYTLSKKICEDILTLFKEQYGVRSTLMYYYNVFGPGEADYGSYSTVIRRFKQKYLQKEPLVIFGDGTKTRAFTHVTDVVNMMIDLLDDTILPEVHLGNTVSVSINDIAKAFKHPIEYVDNIPGEAQHTRCEQPYSSCVYGVLDYVGAWRQNN